MKLKKVHFSPHFFKLHQRNSRKRTCQEIRNASRESKGIVFSISHDDYTKVVGGIQVILSDEHLEFNKRGISYIHLSPALPLRGLSKTTKAADFKFSVRLNGRPLPPIDGQELQDTLEQIRKQGTAPHWVLHHLMGHSPEILQELMGHGTQKFLFWTHDYFAACPGIVLMRNDAEYCNAPPPQSATCSSCKYGQERLEHMARIRRFIEQMQPIITAPSEFALQQWSNATGISPDNSAVIPPVRLELTSAPRTAPARTLRIAYIGRQDRHKGWDVFSQLADQLRHDGRYKFFQFGKAPKGIFKRFGRTVHNVPVAVNARNRNAMAEALERYKIDAVICWSLWAETFNITVHEAMASGAFIIARRQQGNVWLAASRHTPQASRALESHADLKAYFENGQPFTDLANSRRYSGTATPSAGSAELLP